MVWALLRKVTKHAAFGGPKRGFAGVEFKPQGAPKGLLIRRPANACRERLIASGCRQNAAWGGIGNVGLRRTPHLNTPSEHKMKKLRT